MLTLRCVATYAAQRTQALRRIVNQPSLSNPNNAPNIVQINKKLLLERNYELLLASAMTHPSVYPATQIAQTVSWRRIWDNALEYGVKGTKCVQYVLREIC